jgi:DNA-binding transcriptional LysR family regulator
MALDFRHLRQVRVVAEVRSFSRAARALHVSQPTLTRSIQSLEADLGVRLFDRGRRGVEPTAIGRLVLQHARRAEAIAGDLRRELELARGAEIGRLHVGVGPWGGTALIGPAVARLVQQRSQLRVLLTVVPRHEFLERLRHRDVDIVVGDVTGLDEQPDLEVARFSEHRTQVVCRYGHPLTRQASPTLTDLFGYTFAGPPLEPHVVAMLREHPSAEFRRLWSRPEGTVPLSCEVPAILKSILRRTDALSLMPTFMVADELRRRELAVLRGFDIGLGVPYGIAWLRDRTLSPPAAALVDALATHDRELVAESKRMDTAKRA